MQLYVFLFRLTTFPFSSAPMASTFFDPAGRPERRAYGQGNVYKTVHNSQVVEVLVKIRAN